MLICHPPPLPPPPGTSIALTLLWVSGFVLYYESGDGMKFWQSIALAFAVGGSGSEAKLDQSRVPLVGIALPLIFMVLVSAIVLVPSGFRGVRSMWPTRLRRLRFTVGSTPMPWPTIVIVLAHAVFVISGSIRYQEKHVGLPPSLLKGVANIFAYASMVDCALFLVPVSRHSILIAATGVPYELAINFHMQLGWAATFCVALHGGMHGVRWTRLQLNPFSAAAVRNHRPRPRPALATRLACLAARSALTSPSARAAAASRLARTTGGRTRPGWRRASSFWRSRSPRCRSCGGGTTASFTRRTWSSRPSS